MRILEIFSNYALNGAGMHALQLSRELGALGHEVTFLTQTDSWASKQSLPSNVRSWVSSLNIYSPWEVARIIRRVREEKFDIVHSHNTRASNLGAILGMVTSAKSVATAHHQNWQLHWRMHHHVIAVTEMGRRAHIERSGVKPERSSVVHCFVDAPKFAAVTSAEGKAFRQANGLPLDAPVIGIVGHVEPRKGQKYLIPALPAVLKKFPTAKLAIIGTNTREYGKQVKEQAAQLGVTDAIVWIESQKEMGPVYRALDVLVLASLDEQLPLVILEAMASGLPIVSTAVGGIPEVLHDRENGLLVPAMDVPKMEQAILAMLSSAELRKELAAQAATRISEQFAPAVQAQRVVNVFDSLLSSQPASCSHSKPCQTAAPKSRLAA